MAYAYCASLRLGNALDIDDAAKRRYDAAGNTTSYASDSFLYNQRGRMTSAAVSGSTTSYIYSALGQMIEKTGAGGTTYLMYDEAGHLLGEYSSGGALVQETVWIGDIPVATLRPNNGSISTYYVHTDQLNAPRVITRPSDNTIAWRWDTDPFGTAVPNQNPASLGTFIYNLRFPGQYFQAETGLNYNYHRDGYDSATGRYTQSDPIGLLGASYSPYAYTSGNPISLNDPSGKDPFVGATVGLIAGTIYGALGAAADPNASWGSILAGAGAGAVTGALVGLVDLSFGAGTLAVVGAVAGGAGDLVGQVAANAINGNPLDQINYGSTLGAVVGGAISGYGGTVLGNLPQSKLMGELVATSLGTILSSTPGTLLSPSLAAIWDHIRESSHKPCH